MRKKIMEAQTALTLPNLLLLFNSVLLLVVVLRIEMSFFPVFFSLASLPSNSNFGSSETDRMTKTELEFAEKTYQANLQGRDASRHMMLESLADQKTYFIRPVYPCPWEARIGGWRDGGKWICMLPSYKTAPLVVYSIGSNGQTEFEEAMWGLYKAKTFTFDPTLTPEATAKVKSLPYIEFQNVGLTGELNPAEEVQRLPNAAPGATMMRIGQAMKMLGHDYVDVFKIDCEGCEVGVFSDIVNQSTRDKPLFGQILLEVHAFQRFVLQDGLTEKLESLGYRLFHAEDVFYFDEFVELFYLHESLLKA